MRSKSTKAALMLVAALALVAAEAASASAALPELKPTPTLSSPVKFTGHGGAVTPQFFPKELWPYGPISCGEGSKISGEFISAKEVRNLVVELHDCQGSNQWMENGGTLTGPYTVTSDRKELLHGHLGYINKSKKEVGLMLGSESTGKPAWAQGIEYYVAGYIGLGEISGQLITAITPVNKTGKTLTVAATQTEGKQGLTHLEGGLAGQELFQSVLERYSEGPEPMGLELSNTLSSFEQGGKSIEVKLEA